METSKVASIVDGEWEYPVYETDDGYVIDLGGAVGITDPIDDTLEEALRTFREAL